MRVVTLSLVVTGSFLLQGCLAGAWVAVDTMKSSHITFWPFEQSWVAPRDRSSDAMRNSKVTSVAVLPVEGDPEMRARLATVLQQETTLRVESPATVDTVLVSRVAGSPSHPSDWGWKAEGSRRLYLYLLNHDGRLRRSARMPRSEERGGMAAHSEAEANSLLVYKSPAWKGGVLYSGRISSPSRW